MQPNLNNPPILKIPGAIEMAGTFPTGTNIGPTQTATAPTPAPTATAPSSTAPTQPTIANTLAGASDSLARLQGLYDERNATQAGNETVGSFTGSTYEDPYQPDPFDEDRAQRDATRNQMALYQTEIDATNQVYDQLLNEARLQGQGRLGSQRAGAARGGLLGSDFANSQKATVQGYNTDINRGIQAERSAAIGAIMGNVRSSVADEVKAKREARQAGVDEYMDFLNRRDERRGSYRQTLAADMLTQGYDPNQFSEEELVEMLQGSGLKPQDIITEYTTQKQAGEAAGAEADLETRKTEAEIAKIEADIASGKIVKIAEGNMLYNPETGETFKNPKTAAPKSGGTAGVDKIYSSKDLPGAIRADLLDDIKAGQTEEQLISLYPEVNLETIQDYYGQFAPLEEDAGSWWNFWD